MVTKIPFKTRKKNCYHVKNSPNERFSKMELLIQTVQHLTSNLEQELVEPNDGSYAVLPSDTQDGLYSYIICMLIKNQ